MSSLLTPDEIKLLKREVEHDQKEIFPRQGDSMNQELVERLRELAKEVEQTEGELLLVSTEERAIVEAAKAMAVGGTVPYKVLGAMLYYVADMAEE